MKKRPSRGTTKPHGRQTKHEDKPKANSSKSEEETARPEKRITIEVDQMLRVTAKMARHHYRLYYGSNVLADSVRDTHQVALTIAEPEHHARDLARLSHYLEVVNRLVLNCDATTYATYCRACVDIYKALNRSHEPERIAKLEKALSANSSADASSMKEEFGAFPLNLLHADNEHWLLFMTQYFPKVFCYFIDEVADSFSNSYSMAEAEFALLEYYYKVFIHLPVVKAHFFENVPGVDIWETRMALMAFLHRVIEAKASGEQNCVSLQYGEKKTVEIAFNGVTVGITSQAYRTLLVLAALRNKTRFSVEDFVGTYKSAPIVRDRTQKKDPALAGLFHSCMESVKELDGYKNRATTLPPLTHIADRGDRIIQGLIFRIGPGLDGPRDLDHVLATLPFPRQGKPGKSA